MERERQDLIEALQKHRQLFLQTVDGITDEQATMRSTVSELCLGGLVKHVTRVEQRWARFVTDGPGAMAQTPEAYAEHVASFQVAEGERLADILVAYADVAAATDSLVASVPSLDAEQPLPEAPWFPPGATWTARRTFLHVIAETAQHAGHADIVREAIDGAKTMG